MHYPLVTTVFIMIKIQKQYCEVAEQEKHSGDAKDWCAIEAAFQCL